jgi:hypothetical protein
LTSLPATLEFKTIEKIPKREDDSIRIGSPQESCWPRKHFYARNSAIRILNTATKFGAIFNPIETTVTIDIEYRFRIASQQSMNG